MESLDCLCFFIYLCSVTCACIADYILIIWRITSPLRISIGSILLVLIKCLVRGPNDDWFGPRFFDVNKLYDKALRSMAREAAEEVGRDRVKQF